MLFNSYIFILFFLPICICGYYGLNHYKKYSFGMIFLLGMSLWFYAYFNLKYLAIILTSIVINYSVYLLMERIDDEWARKFILIIGLAINIGALVYFKYMDFFIVNINALFNTEYNLWKILLPLGISFFTFQQISFIVDSYNREVPRYSFLHYACYVTFFPQLIAGPIVTHDELVPQFCDESRKRLDWDNLARGINLFVLGLVKKVILADTFGKAVGVGFSNVDALDATNAIIVMLAYTIQIYFDFSGYCDMAIGIGRMFNVELPINFNSPYKALTITEFWDRWHITLTRFLTKYVYIPLGGSRRGQARTYINTLLTFLISGFWHGANWSFIVWGACHGVFMVITKKFKGFFDRLHPALNWMLTFGFVNVMWVIFRADSLPQAMRFLNRIAMLHFGEINSEIASCFKLWEFEIILSHTPIETVYPYFMLTVFFLVAMLLILGNKNAYEKTSLFKVSVWSAIVIAILLFWCIVSFGGVSTFLYFNF